MSTFSASTHLDVDLRPPQAISNERGVRLRSALLLLIGAAVCAFLGIVVAPLFIPALDTATSSDAPKTYLYLSRATAFVALGLTWLSMIFGLLMTGKLARDYPSVPIAFDLHQFCSLLGLAFGLFHALILLGDQYIGYSLTQVLLPFSSTPYRSTWVGLGQLGFYISLVVTFSFFVRNLIGQRGWRLIHFASFLAFVLALLHGLTSGTDTGTQLASGVYWFTASSVIFLTAYRVLVH